MANGQPTGRTDPDIQLVMIHLSKKITKKEADESEGQTDTGLAKQTIYVASSNTQ